MTIPQDIYRDYPILAEAVAEIVARERKEFPDRDEEFWAQFRDVLLAACIERREELLR